jgi:hypothetical protein
MLAHKVLHVLSERLHPGVPSVRPTRVQQGQGLARHEAIVHEEGFFDCQARVATLQLAGAIVLNAVREDKVLGASGREHRVSQHRAQARKGPRQAGGFEKTARNRVATKLPETRAFEKTHVAVRRDSVAQCGASA